MYRFTSFECDKDFALWDCERVFPPYRNIISDFAMKLPVISRLNMQLFATQIGGILDLICPEPGGPSACTTLKNFDCLVKGPLAYHNDTLLHGLQRKLSICSNHGVFPIYPTKIILDFPSKI